MTETPSSHIAPIVKPNCFRGRRPGVLVVRELVVCICGLLLLAACSSSGGSDVALAEVGASELQTTEPTPTASESGQGDGQVHDGEVGDLPVAFEGTFPRLDFETVMPTGQSVAVDCQEEGVAYPYAPYDWPDAEATLQIRQGAGRSLVAVELSGVRPDTYYTVWLRLLGEDSTGATYGGNPLMGIPGTPLIPSSELGNALDAVSAPNDLGASGMHTDANGNASVAIELDFPVIGGAYPFHRFEGFDPADDRYLLDAPSNRPVAIAMTGAPFTLRVASHCKDGFGHGLLPGPHEGWFDWRMPE